MKIKISLLVMVKLIIKINLIQKKLLNHLKNYVINLLILVSLKRSIINLWIMLKILKIIDLKKSKAVFLKTKKKMRRYVKVLKYIVGLYNIKSGSDTSKKGSDASKKNSDTSKKGEGLKILTNKQMLNRLPILLAQIQAGNNSKSLKNELRQILYSLYRSKVLTKTVYNNLIKSIRA